MATRGASRIHRHRTRESRSPRGCNAGRRPRHGHPPAAAARSGGPRAFAGRTTPVWRVRARGAGLLAPRVRGPPSAPSRHHDTQQTVLERLDAEQVPVRRDTGTQVRPDAAVVDHRDIRLRVVAVGIGDQPAEAVLVAAPSHLLADTRDWTARDRLDRQLVKAKRVSERGVGTHAIAERRLDPCPYFTAAGNADEVYDGDPRAR